LETVVTIQVVILETNSSNGQSRTNHDGLKVGEGRPKETVRRAQLLSQVRKGLMGIQGEVSKKGIRLLGGQEEKTGGRKTGEAAASKTQEGRYR